MKLVDLAGLEGGFKEARDANPALSAFWGVTLAWRETSRYREATESEARGLFEAVGHNPDGVLRWIRSRW